MNRHPSAAVDWEVPGTGLDAFFGDGATRAEKILPTLTGLAGVTVLTWYATVTADLDWPWWRHLVAALLVFDLVGGVAANALNSAKRFQHADRIAAPRPAASLIRNHPLFAAIHVQPVLIAALFPGTGIWWGVLWYFIVLAAVAAIPRVPLYLRRPSAMALLALTAMVATVLPHPDGFAWLPTVLVAKLVLGAVQEEPYRPTHAPRPSQEHEDNAPNPG